MTSTGNRAKLESLLAPVKSRLQRQRQFEQMMRFTVVGAAIALAFMFAYCEYRLVWLLPPLALVAFVLFPIVGFLFGANAVVLEEVARLIDDRLNWNDAVSSALQFADNPQPTAMESLHISQTLGFLESVKPQEVLPGILPRLNGFRIALPLLAFASLFLVFAVEGTREERDAVREMSIISRESVGGDWRVIDASGQAYGMPSVRSPATSESQREYFDNAF